MTIPTAPIPGLEEAMQKSQAAQDAAAMPTQSPLEVNVKRVLAGIVGTCGVLITVLPEHTVGYRVCFAVVGFGAALGITSTGNAKR